MAHANSWKLTSEYRFQIVGYYQQLRIACQKQSVPRSTELTQLVMKNGIYLKTENFENADSKF